MDIYEIKIKVFLLRNLKISDVQNYISYFIDSAMLDDEKLLELHNANAYKFYCFDGLFPLASEGEYQKDNIYSFRIRTFNVKLADYLYTALQKKRTKEFQGLNGEIRILRKKLIKKVYSITPVVMKTDVGYWRNSLKLKDFEQQLKDNLCKKYKRLMSQNLDEDFQLYYQINFKNKVPVSRKYKNINLLSDVIELEIAENEQAQQMAWLAIGAGLLEMNARGFGFVNYIYY